MKKTNENRDVVLKVFSTVFLLVQVAEEQFYLIKDLVDTEIKSKTNKAINGIKPFIRTVEKLFVDPERSENYAEEDCELITKIIDAFIQAEEKGLKYKFMNEFNTICQKNNIKI